MESPIIKVASLRSAILLKRHSNTGEICEIFSNTYFVEYLRTAAPDGSESDDSEYDVRVILKV